MEHLEGTLPASLRQQGDQRGTIAGSNPTRRTAMLDSLAPGAPKRRAGLKAVPILSVWSRGLVPPASVECLVALY
jgi:hypothetical protein